MKLLSLAPLAALALLASGCGDVPRLQLSANWPDENLRLSTQQLVFVAREPPAAGQNPCLPLWGEPPTNLAQLARLIDFPNSQDLVAAPLQSGSYTLFAYGIASRYDRLCSLDSDCEGSTVGPRCRDLVGGQKACQAADAAPARVLAGACGEGIIDDQIAYTLTLDMLAPPAR